MDIKNTTFKGKEKKYQGLLFEQDMNFKYLDTVEKFEDLLEEYYREKKHLVTKMI